MNIENEQTTGLINVDANDIDDMHEAYGTTSNDIENQDEKTLRQILEEKQKAIDAERKKRRENPEDPLAVLEKSYDEISERKRALEKAVMIKYKKVMNFLMGMWCFIEIALIISAFILLENDNFEIIMFVALSCLLSPLMVTKIHGHVVDKKVNYWMDKPVDQVNEFIEYRIQRYEHKKYFV